MGIRIRLPGLALAAVGVLGMGYLTFFRAEWQWPQMAVLGVIVLVGVARTLKGA